MPQGQLLGSEEVQQNVSTRFEQACMELKLKGERQRAEKEKADEEEYQKQLKEEARRPQTERLNYQRDAEAIYGVDSYKEQQDDEEERDAILEENSELDILRENRLKQLKKKKEEYLANVARGHGEYVEIVEDEFLKACINSKFCIAHFYHNDFETCKVMDKHLNLLARKHVEAKFFKINAEKTPFFVEKLSIRTLPTLVFFQDGKAIDRLIGFQNLSNGMEFPTRELEERIGQCGVIKMEREFYESANQEAPKKKSSIMVSKTDEFDDPFF